MDVARPAEIAPAVAAAVHHFGRIDILVNNAGIGPPNPAVAVTETDFDATLAVNLKGTFFVSQAVGRAMIAGGHGGRIVNLSSQAGFVALPTESVYCMTKAAIAHLTKCLAVEWAAHGINVNAVAPTFIRTPGTVKWLDDEDFRARSAGAHPARPRRRSARRRRGRRLPLLARRRDDHRHDADDRRRLDGALAVTTPRNPGLDPVSLDRDAVVRRSRHIVVVACLLLAAKVTRHHRRGGAAAGARAPQTPKPAPATDRPATPRSSRAWSGPTLRELLDKAQTPAAIRGHAAGPEGVAISVRASLAGKRDRSRSVRVENGAFEIPGLLFGRSYDLTFTGPDLRPTTLRSVTAPADDVEAQLEALPVLRGAIGFPAGGACNYEQVALRTSDAEPEDVVVVGLNDTCRFELTVPDGPTQMVLLATGRGPPLEMPIVAPAPWRSRACLPEPALPGRSAGGDGAPAGRLRGGRPRRSLCDPHLRRRRPFEQLQLLFHRRGLRAGRAAHQPAVQAERRELGLCDRDADNRASRGGQRGRSPLRADEVRPGGRRGP